MDKKAQRDRRGRFINPHATAIQRKATDFLKWLIGRFEDPPVSPIPEGFIYPIPKTPIDLNAPWAMWIGHSTYLVSIGGKCLLTDPIWSSRCSPLPGIGPKRKILPPLSIEELPRIDYVLISHDHYDHLDKKSVERLNRLFPHILWIVPQGVKGWFSKLGIEKVTELGWWEEAHIDSQFKISAVPSQHFSGRSAPDLNQTLWVGYVLEDLLHGKSLYFVGDTGYNPFDFKEIGKKFPHIDLSLIPIGAYSPRAFMGPVHVEPKDAVKIHIDVGSKLSLAMHWKTFCLSEEPMDRPPFDLYLAMQEAKLNPTTFVAIDPGIQINW